jgi:hypothetical protein
VIIPVVRELSRDPLIARRPPVEKKSKKRKPYRSPKVKSERLKVGVFGEYGTGPIQQLQPWFGLCCT